jgi:hypothetical protein
VLTETPENDFNKGKLRIASLEDYDKGKVIMQ